MFLSERRSFYESKKISRMVYGVGSHLLSCRMQRGKFLGFHGGGKRIRCFCCFGIGIGTEFRGRCFTVSFGAGRV